jgi:hypothetical protein
MGVKFYKYLPSKIKILEHFNCFRKEVKLVLLKNWFYILEEFLSVPVSAITWLNITCKWWGRIKQKYDLYSIVIFTPVQLTNHSYRFVN